MIERLIWVVPLVVAVLGAWRPRAGLVALAAALPLFGSAPGGPYLAALDVAGIAAILTAWRGGRPRPAALTWPAAAFVAVGLASLVPSPYLPPSWQPSVLLGLLRALPGVESWPALASWRAAADLLLGWGLFLAARRAFAGRSVLPLVWGLLSGLAVTVALGLLSFAGLMSLDAYRPEVNDERLSSLFFLSGWLSQYLVLLCPLALVAMAGGRRWLQRAGLLLLSGTLAGIVLTQQRGAWVALLAQLVFWAAIGLRGRWRPAAARRLVLGGALAVGLSALVVIGAGAALEQLWARAGDVESGLTPRLAVWEVAVELVSERPLLGWGLGAWVPAHDLARPHDGSPSRFRGTSHNLYLHLAAERGVLGLASLALLAWAAGACLRRPAEGQETLALTLAVSLVGLAAYGLIQYLFHLRTLGWTFWLLAACVALASRHRGPGVVGRAGRALTLGALLLLPLRAALFEPPAYAGNREFGFHAAEFSPPVGYFRWTEGSAGIRIPCDGEVLFLSLANGHPRAGARPVLVEIFVDGRPHASLELAGGWQELRFRFDPPRREWVEVRLETTPTFRPFSDYLGDPAVESFDIRSLGVAVQGPRCE